MERWKLSRLSSEYCSFCQAIALLVPRLWNGCWMFGLIVVDLFGRCNGRRTSLSNTSPFAWDRVSASTCFCRVFALVLVFVFGVPWWARACPRY